MDKQENFSTKKNAAYSVYGHLGTVHRCCELLRSDKVVSVRMTA